MTRLGGWNPSSVDEKIDRLDSLAEIRQLPPRYALAVDSRDLDTLVSLFIARCSGRAGPLRARRPQGVVFTVESAHFDDPDHAHGIVYCRDELERPEQREWQIGAIQY